MAYIFLQPSNNDNLEKSDWSEKSEDSEHYVSKEEYFLYYAIIGDIEDEIESYYLEKASLNHYNYRTYDYDNDVCKIIHRHLQLKENELMKLSEYGRRTLKDNLWIFADKQKEEFLEQQKQRLQEIKNAKYIQSITSSLENGRSIRETSKSQNQSLTNLSNGSLTKSPIDFLDVVIASAVLNDDDEHSNQCETISEVIETARHYNNEHLDFEKSYSSSNSDFRSSSDNSSSYIFSDDSSSSSSSSSDDSSSSYYSSSSSSDSSYY